MEVLRRDILESSANPEKAIQKNQLFIDWFGRVWYLLQATLLGYAAYGVFIEAPRGTVLHLEQVLSWLVWFPDPRWIIFWWLLTGCLLFVPVVIGVMKPRVWIFVAGMMPLVILAGMSSWQHFFSARGPSIVSASILCSFILINIILALISDAGETQELAREAQVLEVAEIKAANEERELELTGLIGILRNVIKYEVALREPNFLDELDDEHEI